MTKPYARLNALSIRPTPVCSSYPLDKHENI